jgi:hypothetical protein
MTKDTECCQVIEIGYRYGLRRRYCRVTVLETSVNYILLITETTVIRALRANDFMIKMPSNGCKAVRSTTTMHVESEGLADLKVTGKPRCLFLLEVATESSL